jgi:hypothetical protein
MVRFDRTLDGSLSGSPPIVDGLTAPVDGPPGVVAVGLRSSTPAGFSASGVLWHAASTVVIVATSRIFLITTS